MHSDSVDVADYGGRRHDHHVLRPRRRRQRGGAAAADGSRRQDAACRLPARRIRRRTPTGGTVTDVTVSFTAEDALSGVDVVDPPVTLTAEGAGQEAIGTATDRAGNTSATIADDQHRQDPARSCSGCPIPRVCSGRRTRSWCSWHRSRRPMACPGGARLARRRRDEQRERSARAVARHRHRRHHRPGPLDRNGGGSGRTYTVTASVRDLADNAATQSGSCFVPHDRGRR